ncbi:Na+/H+ antiporter NhaA [Acetobacteraceae bacterium]|nr:Na+/H+ antiporter NhaA [Acetobacteraceae bacterium]
MLFYPLTQIKRLAVTEEMILGFAVLLGIILASSPWSQDFSHFLTYQPVSFFPLTVRSWLNEGLLAFFFAVLGVELRADFEVGPLRDWRKALYPLTAAIGALLLPALITVLCVFFAPNADSGLHGWAIPVASAPVLTLPLLAMINYIPTSVKSFVRAVLVFDDLFAVTILICFYGSTPNFLWLGGAGLLAFAMYLIGHYARQKPAIKRHILGIMMPITLMLWIALCKAGTPASMAGLIVGLTMPHRSGHTMMRTFSNPVAWLILPLFAVCNTSIDVRVITPAFFETSAFLGPLLGFLIGKPLGIFGGIFICEKAGLKTPWKDGYCHWLIGAVMSCAIGFTVSLLLTQLAYGEKLYQMQAQTGIAVASIIATALTLYFLKRSDKWVEKRKAAKYIPIAKHGKH